MITYHRSDKDLGTASLGLTESCSDLARSTMRRVTIVSQEYRRKEEPCLRSSQGVTESDSTSNWVDLLERDLEVFNTVYSLRCECLVTSNITGQSTNEEVRHGTRAYISK